VNKDEYNIKVKVKSGADISDGCFWGELFGGANVRSAFVLHSREKEGGAVAGVAWESTSFYGS